jgi:hypothetical protein
MLYSIPPQHTNFFTQIFGHTLMQVLVNVALLIGISYLVYRLILEPIYSVIDGMYNFWRLRKSKATFLEVTPPLQSEKLPLATGQLMSILQRLTTKHGIMSLEIMGSHKEGIRYLIRTFPEDVALVQRHIASYLPEAHFRVLEDAASELPGMDAEGNYAQVYEIRQARHYPYPLKPQDDLNQSDPVAFIAGSMTKLQPGEAMVLQMVLAPHQSYWTNRLYNKIHSKGWAIIDGRVPYYARRYWWVWLITAFIGYYSNDIKFTLSWAFVLLVVAWYIIKHYGVEPVPTQSEQELYASILDKLGQPLFKTDIRMLLVSDTTERLHELGRGLASSLAPLESPFQALHVPRVYLEGLGQKLSYFKFKHRMPSFFILDSNILSASELASIYHFPYGTITTEGMARSHSRTLAASPMIKSGKFDVVLGNNNHHGEETAIGLTAAERERHIFIIGGTGNGKTTMLQYAIAQDIQNGKNVAVIDPHGDMAATLLRHIPKDRIKDVIYFNPDDLAHPIGLNLLELPPGLSGDELAREKDLVTEAIVSMFRKIFSEDDTGGHRIEYVLRNTIQTALTTENPTLFTIFDLLNDHTYRKTIINQLEDKDLKNFWKNELGKAGNFQQVKMISGITAKIGRFLFSASAKRVLEQHKSTIDFDDILNNKILICNFSKGLLGEDTSELFGIAALAKIQIASLRRARMKQADRKPFYLYVDEFQNFATPSFVQMLSEARKYKLYMTMAEQSTSQQDDQKTVNIILANVGTVICFRSGNPADERLVLPLFQPYIKEGEIANLPSFNFYMRIAALQAQEPLSGVTVVLEVKGSEDVAQKVIASSRVNYAKERSPKIESRPSPSTGKKADVRTETSNDGKPKE